MKKTILTTIFVSLFLSVSAQWNSTGDSKTTGSLTVGSDVNGTSTNLRILGANTPFLEEGKRDIVFDYKLAGKAVIRSLRSSGWGNGLQFLTTTTTPDPELRLKFHEGIRWTSFYDSQIHLGDDLTTDGVGTELHFKGNKSTSGHPFIRSYSSGNKTDMQVVFQGGSSRYSVGDLRWNNGVSSFYPLFSIYNSGNVAIGTADSFIPTYKLEVNGTIRAKEVRVETGWADFVFKSDYKLPTLQEVKAHIDEHKHLPGMPSEAEVKENGVGLADATTKLLQKVEELTLYAIQQQETIDKLTKEVDDLKNSQK